MKRLTCEMCGSTDLIKQEGVFVCQVCGCKYSVEEAKRMMVEGIVEVTGTVKVDNTDKITNYLDLAKTAKENGNNAEAEEYSNKILEIEPNNYQAWLIKGRAAGWQSTLAKKRVKEAVDCFTNAFNYAPEDMKETVKTVIREETQSICSALLSLYCRNYAEYYSESASNDIINNFTVLAQYVSQINVVCGIKGIQETLNDYAIDINNAVVEAGKGIWKDYWGATHHPSGNDISRFRDRMMRSCLLYRVAALTTNVDREIKNSFDNAIRCVEQVRDVKQYFFSNGAWRAQDSWNSSYVDELNTKINNLRMECNEQLEKRRKEVADEKKARIDKYWEMRSDEKLALENELEQIQQKMNEIEAAAEAVTGQEEIDAKKTRRERIQRERDSLGFFKGKQKAALDEEIKWLNDQIYSLENDRRNKQTEIRKEKAPLLARKKEIEQELTMDRPEE